MSTQPPAENYFDFDDDATPVPIPDEDRCPGCDAHKDAETGHRFSCWVKAPRLKFYVDLNAK
jgi:hypothetical protein